jgi:NADH-quinone oxidoreductase subunit N
MIIKGMYFDEPAKGFLPMAGELKIVLGVTGLFNLLYFIYPAPLDAAAGVVLCGLTSIKTHHQ